jgi:hypothetical protein
MSSFKTKLGRSIMAAKEEDILLGTLFKGNPIMQIECAKMRNSNIRYAMAGINQSRASGNNKRPEAEYCIFKNPEEDHGFVRIRFKFKYADSDVMHYMTFRVQSSEPMCEFKAGASEYFAQIGTDDENESALLSEYERNLNLRKGEK